MQPTKTPKTQNLIERPPVIAVMGHIDHGKSSLLDYIRKANTTKDEAGGITQHVAAYEVHHTTKAGKETRITFIDTPGHAAFKGIRTRGANIADIAILVVSGEDGVKPQTLEALQAIKAAETPYVVAINKIDSPKADVERTKTSLAENEIYVEGYGGDIPWVAISAKTGEGVPDLLDTLLLVAELEELRADPSVPAEGFLIEASRDTKKGIAATLIIKNGTLRKGMALLAGSALAPIRMIEDVNGKQIDSATFSTPVKLVGFDKAPQIGDTFRAFATKKEAEAALEADQDAAQRAAEAKKSGSGKQGQTTAANPLPPSTLMTIIPLVIKTDVGGTLEAIEHELSKLKKERIALKVIHSGVGDITESDIKSAIGSSTIDNPVLLVSFNTKVDPLARSLAERSNVAINSFSIIYKLIEWVDAAMTAKTPKIQVEESTGKSKIQKVFSKNKDKQIVGGKVLEGALMIGDDLKIYRREAEIGSGKVRELQQQKLKATEAKKDTEFGTMIESKIEIMPGDIVESFQMVTK